MSNRDKPKNQKNVVSNPNRRNGKAPKKNPKTPRRTGRTTGGRTPEGHKRHLENVEIYEQRLAMKAKAEEQRKLREKAGVRVEANAK